jgi:glycosyltransferase involved in cell wall biosynthesis
MLRTPRLAKKTVTFDALPLIFEGGISNYVKPLVRHVVQEARSGWTVQLLFRISVDRSRHQRYRTFRPFEGPFTGSSVVTRVPDRVLRALWGGFGYPPFSMSRRRKNAFIATTDMVPRRGSDCIGWIVYDLTPLRIPDYFDLNQKRFHKKMLGLSQRTDFIVTISENSKKDIAELLDYPENRIRVIYPGVTDRPSLYTASPPRSGQRPYVYYIGSLALNKNIDGMLRIFSDCVNRHGLDIDILLTGRDFLGSGFWNPLIQDLHIDGRVHLTGWISDDERDAYLSHAAMLWQFSWYEGFGLPVLEAASRGIPVLYSNRGSLPEIINDPEQEMDPERESEAADKAAAALTSPAILTRWKERGLQRSAAFSWSRSARNLLDDIETYVDA